MHTHPLRTYGYLVAPALIAAIYPLGRGAGNTAYALYWLAACVLIVRARSFRVPPKAALLFVALLAWGALSATLSVDARSSWDKWLQFLLLGSSFFITAWWLRRIPQFDLDFALKLVGLIGLLAYAYYGCKFLVLASRPDFHPESEVQGLVPAYLAPFSIYLLWQQFHRVRARLIVALYMTSLFLLLLFSNSLTEVVTLTAATLVMMFLLANNKTRVLLWAGGLLLVLVALVLEFNRRGLILSQFAHAGGSWLQLLDHLSSYRTYLWRKAFAFPPPNEWWGVGPGNVHLYPPVDIEGIGKVQHLHNLLLDCWYETGAIGLALYVAFYAGQLSSAWRAARSFTAFQNAIVWASIAGIFWATMLEQSYRSYHAAAFVPFLLALYGYAARDPRGDQSFALRPPSTAST